MCGAVLGCQSFATLKGSGAARFKIDFFFLLICKTIVSIVVKNAHSNRNQNAETEQSYRERMLAHLASVCRVHRKSTRNGEEDLIVSSLLSNLAVRRASGSITN